MPRLGRQTRGSRAPAPRIFRAGVDCGGETGRTGSNNGNIIDQVRVDRPHQADTAGKLVFAWIAEQLTVRAQYDRQLTGIDVEALYQRFGLGVGLWIERLLRLAIAPKKIRQPQHIPIVCMADDYRAA